MTSIPFDTLKMMERLESAGFTNAQARVQIEVLAEVIGKESAGVADRYLSKQEFAPEIAGIRASLGTLDVKIDKVAAEVKSELIRWVVSVGVLQTTLIAALLLKLTH